MDIIHSKKVKPKVFVLGAVTIKSTVRIVVGNWLCGKPLIIAQNFFSINDGVSVINKTEDPEREHVEQKLNEAAVRRIPMLWQNPINRPDAERPSCLKDIGALPTAKLSAEDRRPRPVKRQASSSTSMSSPARRYT
jgi:hypothetical protein